MENLIIPNIHPVIVHFSIALMTTAAALFVIAFVRGKTGKDEKLVYAARLIYWIGFGAVILTILAGIQASGSVDHDGPSHAAMMKHGEFGVMTGIAFLVASIMMFRERAKDLGKITFGLMLVGSVMLVMTAYRGGHLVFVYGLGVQSLPQVTGEGHDHEHAEGEGHGDAPAAAPEASAPEASAPAASAPEAAEEEGGHSHDTVAAAEGDDPAKVADALNAALHSGDVEAVRMLLAEDVMILEGGHAQKSREEYMSGHMKSDMKFLANLKSEVISRETSQSGDLAWIITHTKSTGTFKDKAFERTSREMLVMRHDGHNWKITLVHWGE